MDDGDICSLAGPVTTTTITYCLLPIIASHSHLIYSHVQLISIVCQHKLFL
jgi:hypothetical protein